MAEIIPFARLLAAARQGLWSAAERAELERMAGDLLRAGAFEVAQGMADGGDPWFAVADSRSGETLVHVARIGGRFVLHHVAADVMDEDRDLRTLIQRTFTHLPADATLASAAPALIGLALLAGSPAVAAGAPPSARPAVEEPPRPGAAPEPEREAWAAVVLPAMVLLAPREAAPAAPPAAEAMADPPLPGPAGDAAAPTAGALGLPLPDDRPLVALASDDRLPRGGDDRPGGGAVAQRVLGGDGDDTLVGGRGAEVLDGGPGRDVLYIGAGIVATGGPGADLFIVSRVAPGETPAVITDFSPEESDRIETAEGEPVPVPAGMTELADGVVWHIDLDGDGWADVTVHVMAAAARPARADGAAPAEGGAERQEPDPAAGEPTAQDQTAQDQTAPDQTAQDQPAQDQTGQDRIAAAPEPPQTMPEDTAAPSTMEGDAAPPPGAGLDMAVAADGPDTQARRPAPTRTPTDPPAADRPAPSAAGVPPPPPPATLAMTTWEDAMHRWLGPQAAAEPPAGPAAEAQSAADMLAFPRAPLDEWML